MADLPKYLDWAPPPTPVGNRRLTIFVNREDYEFFQTKSAEMGTSPSRLLRHLMRSAVRSWEGYDLTKGYRRE
jgi:hypothetical protein